MGIRMTRRAVVLRMAGIAAIALLAGCGEEDRVRACLKKNSGLTGGVDHVYLNEVVSVETWQSYPDGTATYFVKYKLKGRQGIHDTTCRW